MFLVGFKNDLFLFVRPWLLVDQRIKVIMPSFATLFSGSSLQVEVFFHFDGYDGPFTDAILVDELSNGFIFL